MNLSPGLRSRLRRWATDELQPKTLVSSLLTGSIIATLEMIVVISLVALVFANELSGQLPRAIGFVLLGEALICGAIALLSSHPGTIAVSQDTPGAILGVGAMAMVAALSADGVEAQFATVVMMLVVTTAATGILFLLLGMLKLGALVRFLPYPVLGGFLAGTGWLLATGGASVMTGLPPGWAWFAPQRLLFWMPGALLGGLIWWATAVWRRPFVLPLVLAGATALFYAVISWLGISMDSLQAGGWMIGAMPTPDAWQLPFSSDILADVSWPVLLTYLPTLAPAAIISVIGLLLNASGLELMTRSDLDLNRELVAAGAGNLLAAPLGPLIGYHAISLTSLSHSGQRGRRMTGVFVALWLATILVLGPTLLQFIPKMMLGAVLVYLGLDLLIEWVVSGWFKFPRIDFAIVASILAVIIFIGFLEGIVVGLVLAIILFVVNYSRTSVIRFTLTGRAYRSRVTRPLRQQEVLAAEGDRIAILKLQGFLFFGTANTVFGHLRQAIGPSSKAAGRFALLDFAQVSGLDSTAMLSFRRMAQWAEERDVTLVLTGLRGRTAAQFDRGGFQDGRDGVRLWVSLDRGLEWCENEILAAAPLPARADGQLREQLAAVLDGAVDADRVMGYLQRQEFAPGEYLIRQGERANQFYFIETGQITAQLETPKQPPTRLETMQGGRLAGELGFYLDIERTAAVIVDEPSVVYSLSKAQLARLEETDPEAASILHRLIIRRLSERVVHLMETVSALER